MFLITSAAYVNSEFVNELGLLPPAFLPLQNVRLFEHQVLKIKEVFPEETIYLSLPTSFEIPFKDECWLKSHSIKIIRLDENISLGESVLISLERASIDSFVGELRILHGDTYQEIINEIDFIAVSKTSDNYSWKVDNNSKSSEIVWNGYFAFSNGDEFKRLIGKSKKFEKSVFDYDCLYGLKRIFVDNWYDFGHINTYFRSRTKYTSERAFNHLHIENRVLTKTSRLNKKIQAEEKWYRNAPNSIKSYLPQLFLTPEIISQEDSYSIEFLPILPLNELYVHGQNPILFWSNIFKLIKKYFGVCFESSGLCANKNLLSLNSDFEALVHERLHSFFESSVLVRPNQALFINDIALPPLEEIVRNCLSSIKKEDLYFGFLHGDLCFSNILYDSRASDLKLVDPRGLDFRGNFCSCGDIRYDLAKFAHSVVGYYDFILAGAFDLSVKHSADQLHLKLDIFINSRINQISELFLSEKIIDGYKTKDVLPIVVLLFLNMLPLHRDNILRQNALFANALRIYSGVFNDCDTNVGI